MTQHLSYLLFGWLLFSFVQGQDVPAGKCLLLTQVTDFEQIPETNAQLIVWDMSDSASFSQEMITDIDGKNSIMLDQGKMYAIKIFKSDTSFMFNNITIPEHEAGIIMNYSFQIKVIQGYKIMPSEFQTSSTETSADLLELGIHFISNSAEIPKNDLAGLDEIYDLLSKNNNYRIELASYTDDVGNEENNMRLSQRRSDAVKAFLVSKGINEAQIVAKGYGEKQPKASNDTDVGRASNRRTELRFIK